MQSEIIVNASAVAFKASTNKINQYQKCNKSDKKQHPFVFFHVITSLSTKVGIKFLLNQRNC